jgi:predicted RNA-binding protein associated with RNAse of E/G family
MEEGAWHFKHTYYDRNNDEKGEYFNICTPIEIFPTKIRYIDLEVDVVRFPDGESRIIDEEHLRKRVEEGIFPEKIASLAMREADMILTSYESELL